MINNYLDIFSNIVKEEAEKNPDFDSQFRVKLLFDKCVNLFYKKIRDRQFPIPSKDRDEILFVGKEERMEVVGGEDKGDTNSIVISSPSISTLPLVSASASSLPLTSAYETFETITITSVSKKRRIV